MTVSNSAKRVGLKRSKANPVKRLVRKYTPLHCPKAPAKVRAGAFLEDEYQKQLLGLLDLMQTAVEKGLVYGPAEVGIMASKLIEFVAFRKFKPMRGDDSTSIELWSLGLHGDIRETKLEKFLDVDRWRWSNHD